MKNLIILPFLFCFNTHAQFGHQPPMLFMYSMPPDWVRTHIGLNLNRPTEPSMTIISAQFGAEFTVGDKFRISVNSYFPRKMKIGEEMYVNENAFIFGTDSIIRSDINFSRFPIFFGANYYFSGIEDNSFYIGAGIGPTVQSFKYANNEMFFAGIDNFNAITLEMQLRAGYDYIINEAISISGQVFLDRRIGYVKMVPDPKYLGVGLYTTGVQMQVNYNFSGIF